MIDCDRIEKILLIEGISMKKLFFTIISLLAVFFTATQAVYARGTETEGKSEPWRAPLLREAGHEPYMSGRSSYLFAPDDYLTRAELCGIIDNLFVLSDNGYISEFEDVERDKWYYTAVKAVTAAGAMLPSYGRNFEPDAYVSREDFIYALTLYDRENISKSAEPAFSDVKYSRARDSIEYAASKGWIEGFEDGVFLPAATVPRAEAARVINRALGRSAYCEETLSMLKNANVCSFADVPVCSPYYADICEAVLEHSFDMESGAEKWTEFAYKPSGYGEGIWLIDGKYMSVDENGQFNTLVPSEVQEVNGRLYHTLPDASVDLSRRGVCEVNGSMYFFEEDGSVKRNGNYGYLYFGNDGKYTCGNTELDLLVDEALAKCANESMTQSEKLRAAYLYLRDGCVYLSRAHHPRGATDFVEESAAFILKNMKGNCYCYSSAFLLMARRLGYDDAYVVSGGVGVRNLDHAWVMIGSKIYDPELEYAYRYRYKVKKDYDLYDMDADNAPFVYYFPA